MSHAHTSIVKVFTSDGTAQNNWAALQLTGVPDNVLPNKSTICVVDGVTLLRGNTSGASENVKLMIQSQSGKYVWAGGITIPDGEYGTIDKEFVGGLPLWAPVAETGSTTNDPKNVFASSGGVYLSSTTPASAYWGSVEVRVNNSALVPDLSGEDCLSVRYHFEPTSLRRS